MRIGRAASEASALPSDEGDHLFRMLVECVSDYAIFLLDPGGRVATWNLGAERLKGYRRDEILGRHFSVFHPPEEAAAGAPERLLAEAERHGRSEHEGWRVRKDGSRFWASVVLTAVRDAEGSLRGFAKVTRDLTARREAEENEVKLAAERAARAERLQAMEALRESEAQFHALADSIPQLAWIADASGAVEWYNRRWYEYTGTTPEAMRGWGWQAVHDPADLPRVLAGWRAALHTGEAWEDEFRLRRHDGAMRWHLSRAVPVRDARGAVVRWFGTNTDIEDQRRTLAELQRAEEEARRVGRLQEQLLAVVSHDLRTPLSAIVMGAYVIQKRGELSPEQERTLAQMRSSAARMSTIVGELLDFSRARQGLGIPVKKAEMDLAEVCRRTLLELSGVHRDRRVALTVEGDARLQGDGARLAQVISNLVGNALQHGAGEARVAVVGREHEVELSVHNRGDPIPAEELPHLFEPFRRGRDSEEGEELTGSVGLGLFIVAEIVRAHGGTVEVRSSAAAGTTFTVSVPRRAERGSSPAPPEEGGAALSL